MKMQVMTKVNIPETVHAPPTKKAIDGINKNKAMSRFDSAISWLIYTYLDRFNLNGTMVKRLKMMASMNGTRVCNTMSRTTFPPDEVILKYWTSKSITKFRASDMVLA